MLNAKICFGRRQKREIPSLRMRTTSLVNNEERQKKLSRKINNFNLSWCFVSGSLEALKEDGGGMLKVM